MSATGPNTPGRVEESLARLRGNDRNRRIALAGAIIVGLALGTVHWLGLFVAGALVGLTRKSLLRALFAGFAFGVLVLALFFLVTPTVGPANLGSLAPLSYLTVGLGVLAPTWGALVRGVV